MSHTTNVLSPMTIVSRVNREYDSLDEKGKERVRRMIARVAVERAERARKERIAVERAAILQRFEERAHKAQEEVKDLSVLQIHKEDFKRAYALREAEKREPSQGGLVSFGAKLQSFLEKIESETLPQEVVKVDRIREEFILLLEVTPREVLSGALDLMETQVEETWEGLEALQEAIEVVLDL